MHSPDRLCQTRPRVPATIYLKLKFSKERSVLNRTVPALRCTDASTKYKVHSAKYQYMVPSTSTWCQVPILYNIINKCILDIRLPGTRVTTSTFQPTQGRTCIKV